MSWILRTLLTITAVALPLFLYIGFRVAASLTLLRPEWKQRSRRVVFVVTAWCFILPVSALVLQVFKATSLLFVFSDSITWFDFLFHYPVWIGLIVVVELFLPFVILDLLALASRTVPAWRPVFRRVLAYVRITLAALAIVYVPVRVALDTAFVRDTTFHVPVHGLPAELEGLRITLVGDIQVDRYTGAGKVGQVEEIVRRQKPEFIFSSGDIVSSGTGFLKEAARVMCGLKGSAGSIAVMGDHDYWSAPAEVRALQVDCGWTFLENTHRLIDYRGRTLCVSGLTHIYADRMSDGELDQFLGSAPAADIQILLAHQPAERVIAQATRHGYDLLLAGHTHGGQVVLHPLGIPLTPSMRETRYYTGYHRLDSMAVVVTNGVGLTLAPVRYHAPAEVTTVVLEK